MKLGESNEKRGNRPVRWEDVANLVRARLETMSPFRLAHQLSGDPTGKAFVTPADVIAVRDGTPVNPHAKRSFEWIAEKWLRDAAVVQENASSKGNDPDDDNEPVTDAKDPTYDLAAKNRIRQQLREYMHQHEIGIPRLVARMVGAPDLTPTNTIEPEHYDDGYPVHTMKRFLAGKNVENVFITKCVEFLDKEFKPQSTVIAVQLGLKQFFMDPDEALTVWNESGPIGQKNGKLKPEIWLGALDLPYHYYLEQPESEKLGFCLRLNETGLLSIVDLDSGMLFQGFLSECGGSLAIIARSKLIPCLNLFCLMPYSPKHQGGMRTVHVWHNAYRQKMFSGLFRLELVTFSNAQWPEEPPRVKAQETALKRYLKSLEELADATSF